jgi:hypothetical protein
LEEYYIDILEKGESIKLLHLYHDALFSEEDIKKMINDITNEFKKLNNEDYWLKHYIEYKLRDKYKFYGYSKRNIYTFELEELDKE